MKAILTIALSVLMLSGCIAEWKNPNGPQRWSDSPRIDPMYNNTGMANANSGGTP